MQRLRGRHAEAAQLLDTLMPQLLNGSAAQPELLVIGLQQLAEAVVMAGQLDPARAALAPLRIAASAPRHQALAERLAAVRAQTGVRP